MSELCSSETPFMVLGVNSDADVQTAIESAQTKKLPWSHLWDGREGHSGPIAKRWNVTRWPTAFLIDPHGVIRARHFTHKPPAEIAEMIRSFSS